MGADVLFYPTAIGSEPDNTALDTKDLWQRAMIGHAVSNVVPVVAANRIGNETRPDLSMDQVLHRQPARRQGRRNSDRTEEGVHGGRRSTSTKCAATAPSFGFFRDRRPELYGPLTEK